MGFYDIVPSLEFSSKSWWLEDYHSTILTPIFHFPFWVTLNLALKLPCQSLNRVFVFAELCVNCLFVWVNVVCCMLMIFFVRKCFQTYCVHAFSCMEYYEIIQSCSITFLEHISWIICCTFWAYSFVIQDVILLFW